MGVRFLLMSLIAMSLAAQQPRILVHGHRGARAVRPENTIPAFTYAIEAGVDVLELDMAVTKDDVVVVSHDLVLPEAICQGPANATRVIREMTFAELERWDCGTRKNPKYPKQQPVPGTRVPALDEVFALKDRGPFHFNIETKIFKDKPQLAPPPERFVELVLAVIRKHQLEDRVILQSFDFRTLKAMKKLEPRIRLSALEEFSLKSFASIAKDAGGAPIVSPQFRMVTKGKVADAHRKKLQVVPWTPNEPGQWESLVEAGVDAIITDDPAELIAFLKRKGLR